MITKYQCEKIIKENNGFYKKIQKVDDIEFSIYSYKIVDYSDFFKYSAFELRGLTFINDFPDKPFYSIHKFFNLNENEFYSLSNIKKLIGNKIKIREKIDGSLISTIYHNDKIYVKSKTSFNSIQAKKSQEFINENKNYQDFIKYCYDNNLQPIFEYVSPENQIVLFYPEIKLICIQIRTNRGKYLDYFDYLQLCKKFNIPYVKEYNYLLDDLIKLQEIEKDIEGWVASNINQTFFFKVKTNWYLERHRLIAPDNLRENLILEYILNETIDDIISYLSFESEKRKYLENIRQKVNFYFNKKVEEIFIILKENQGLSRKEFALKFKDNHEYFSVLIKCFGIFDREKVMKELKEYLLRNYNRQERAKRFFERIENEIN